MWQSILEYLKRFNKASTGSITTGTMKTTAIIWILGSISIAIVWKMVPIILGFMQDSSATNAIGSVNGGEGISGLAQFFVVLGMALVPVAIFILGGFVMWKDAKD